MIPSITYAPSLRRVRRLLQVLVTAPCPRVCRGVASATCSHARWPCYVCCCGGGLGVTLPHRRRLLSGAAAVVSAAVHHTLLQSTRVRYRDSATRKLAAMMLFICDVWQCPAGSVLCCCAAASVASPSADVRVVAQALHAWSLPPAGACPLRCPIERHSSFGRGSRC